MMYRRALDQRVAEGTCIGDQWNADPERFKLWQAYVAMVFLDDRDLRDLGRLSGMTSWSFNFLTEHQEEVRQCKFNEVNEARLDRWASVGYATCRC